MLKIKDDVDLKELEKYGVFPIDDEEKEFGKIVSEDTDAIFMAMEVNKKRELEYMLIAGKKVKFDESYYILCNDTLYDLISDGLIEKV